MSGPKDRRLRPDGLTQRGSMIQPDEPIRIYGVEVRPEASYLGKSVYPILSKENQTF